MGSRRYRSRRRRLPLWRRMLLPLSAGLGILALGVGVAVLLSVRTAGGYVHQGLALLAETRTAAQMQTALLDWEGSAGVHDPARREALVTHLLEHETLSHRRVQLLLRWLTGADYGERANDWQRARSDAQAVAMQKPLPVSRREHVALAHRWTAAVGLTSWFSTIHALDGAVFVASLGRAFADQEDDADGVVRVDGRTGDATLFFAAPATHPGPRDVIGLSAGPGCLFAACRNGYVYCLAPDQAVRWHADVGSAAAGPPLTIDTNADGVLDVVVPTLRGAVVALSGSTGNRQWVAQLARPRGARETQVGVALAAGAVLGEGGTQILVTTPGGTAAVLRLHDGATLWSATLEHGVLGGAACRSDIPASGPPAYFADRVADVWSLVRMRDTLEVVRVASLGVRPADTVVGGLRLVAGADGQHPRLLIAPTGDYATGWGAVALQDAGGLQWRSGLSVAVWATPAVADLNGDGAAEIVVAGIGSTVGPGRPTRGALLVLSAAGHLLAYTPLEAECESSPVIADVDGDGLLDILIADQSGQLHCFSTGVYGPVEWGSVGGDSHNTRNAQRAYAFGQLAFGSQWDWVGPPAAAR